MTATETAAMSFMLIGLCDGGSSSSDRDPFVITCSEYQLMIDVELEFGQECSLDAQCDQVLTGTGVGCETDDLVVRNDYNATYVYDMIEDAEDAGCTVEFDTTGECPPDGETACVWTRCSWL